MLANDGREAVDILLAHPAEIDIVLMNIQMPVLDGFEATRLIRSTPVLALTAGAFSSQQEEAFAAGMTGYIAKPFDVEQAIVLILQLCSRAGLAALSVTAVEPSAGVEPPGISVTSGLAIWKDVTLYKQYLRKFARDYADCVSEMKNLAPAQAQMLAHKLKSAAGSLALLQVAELAARTDRALCADEDPAGSLLQLQAALEMVLSSISHYAPAVIVYEQAVLRDSAQTALVFKRMRDALDTDRMTAVRPVLAELGGVLSTSQMAAVTLAVEAYDFKSGKAAIGLIAANMGISLG